MTRVQPTKSMLNSILVRKGGTQASNFITRFLGREINVLHLTQTVQAVYFAPTSSPDDIGKGKISLCPSYIYIYIYIYPNSFDCILVPSGNELPMELGMELLGESVACFVFVSEVEKELNW